MRLPNAYRNPADHDELSLPVCRPPLSAPTHTPSCCSAFTENHRRQPQRLRKVFDCHAGSSVVPRTTLLTRNLQESSAMTCWRPSMPLKSKAGDLWSRSHTLLDSRWKDKDGGTDIMGTISLWWGTISEIPETE